MAASTTFSHGEVTTYAPTRRRTSSGSSRGQDRNGGAFDHARYVERELTQSFAKSYCRTWPFHLLLVIALFCASSLWVPLAMVLPAFVVIAGAVLATAFACYRYLDRDPPTVPIRTWRLGFVLGELGHGMGWILFALPFYLQGAGGRHDVPSNSYVLVAVLLVMVATAILRAPIPAAVVAGMMPLSLVVALAATQADGTESWVLVLLTLSAQLFLGYFANRLHRATAAMLRSRAEIEASFAELQQARANSNEARLRAEEADRAKTLFLATMSHELRTPLNAILGFSEVMKNEVLGSHSTPSYREYSSDIHGSGQHLLSLINAILDLARIEAGHYALTEDHVRMSDAVAEGLAGIADQAEAKGYTITKSVETSLDPIRVDRRALQQILANLLSNAVKFTAPGGHIAVKAGWTSRGGQYVSVKNDGPGLSPEEIPMALSSFGRGLLAVSTAAQGIGLGLPIVKGLTELHQGRFVFTSDVLKGTEATVIFPASRVVSGRDAASEQSPDIDLVAPRAA